MIFLINSVLLAAVVKMFLRLGWEISYFFDRNNLSPNLCRAEHSHHDSYILEQNHSLLIVR